MNLLHTLVAALIENFSTVAGVLSACFRLGVALSYLTVFACTVSFVYFLLYRSSRRLSW
jgi:hypothetical protein